MESLLRTRGGHSDTAYRAVYRVDSSPHARRSFLNMGGELMAGRLFSARAEVIPGWKSFSSSPTPLLRTRGGHSDA